MRIIFTLLALLGIVTAGNAQAIIDVHLEVTDLSDTTITTIEVGEPFKLRVLVEDIRPNSQGVFSDDFEL